MDHVRISTAIDAPPPETYDFLVDFHHYGRYSEYLTEVRQHGDGDVGTDYEFLLEWWRLSHTFNSTVTALQTPERIGWEILGPIDAHGSLTVTPTDQPAVQLDGIALPDPGVSPYSYVALDVFFDPASFGKANFGLPRFLSPAALIDRLKPKAESQAKRIVERVVADIEGDARPIDLRIETGVATPGDGETEN